MPDYIHYEHDVHVSTCGSVKEQNMSTYYKTQNLMQYRNYGNKVVVTVIRENEHQAYIDLNENGFIAVTQVTIISFV
jgi:hypothetical protein